MTSEGPSHTGGSGRGLPVCVAALRERPLQALLSAAPSRPADQLPPASAPPHFQRRRTRLHQQLRQNAQCWLAAYAIADRRLPDVLTAEEMMDALGCGNQAFRSWLRAGLLPGGRVWPGGVWRCTTVTFVCWLGTDGYWFPATATERAGAR